MTKDTNSTIETITSLVGVATESVTGVGTALKVIKGVKDLVKGDDTGVSRKVREQLVDLADQLITVKEQNNSLRQALLEVKEELSGIQKFEADADNYTLEKVGSNAFAYMAKGSTSSKEEGPHYCAHCFENKKKSLLQFSKAEHYSNILICPECGTETHVAVDRGPLIMTAPRPERKLW